MNDSHTSYLPRRSFLVLASYAGLSGLIVGCRKPKPSSEQAKPASAPTTAPSAAENVSNEPLAAPTQTVTPAEPDGGADLANFVAFDESGTLTIVVARSEMGQSVRTSMAMLVADALDFPWSQVKVVQAIGDVRYGDQNTDGSTSAREQFEPLQTAGKLARSLLLLAAADSLHVPVAELATNQGEVIHSATGKKRAYTELVKAAREIALPKKALEHPRSSVKLLGESVPRIDLQEILTGRAIYGNDVTLPGMVYASIERCPEVGGNLGEYKKEAALAIAGVTQVVELPAAGAPANLDVSLAVVATSTWSAFQGRKQLAVTWQGGRNHEATTASVRQELAGLLGDDTNAKVMRKQGDFAEAWKIAAAQQAFSRDYHTKYIPHLPMEPPVCTARWNGESLDIWAPVQSPQSAQEHLAQALVIPAKNITVHVTLLGGAFGRKGQVDFVVEAALLARALQKPVQVAWTREDEIRHGFYRPATAQRLRASISENGDVLAWAHRSSFGSIRSTFEPEESFPWPWEASMGRTDPPLRASRQLLDTVGFRSPLRIGWVRAVHYVHHQFAISCFLDELAAHAKRDPIAYFLAQLDSTKQKKDEDGKSFEVDRLAAVIQRVASLAQFDGTKPMGFSACKAFGSYVATIVEVDPNMSKKLRVLRTWTVVDCGQVLHPGHALAQVQGSIVFGLSETLYGGVDLENGAVVQGNFDSLPVLRGDACPEIHAEFIESTLPPQGLGEPVVATVAPALCNAIAKATGQRIYDLPLRNAFAV